MGFQTQVSHFLDQLVVGLSVLLLHTVFQLLWPEVGEAVRPFFLSMLLEEVLLLKPFLQFVLTFKNCTHLGRLVQTCRCFLVKFDSFLNLAVYFLEFVKFLLQFGTVLRPGAFCDAHLENLFGQRNLTLQVDPDIRQIKTSIVAHLDPLERLSVQQSLDLISILHELSRLRKLLPNLCNKVVVDH